jgi:acyl dehydratase
VPAFETVQVGDRLPELTETLDQAWLVRYAGASGDLNPLHWDPEFAAKVSPSGGVIAHGMLNMGLVSRLVSAWAGGPEQVRSLDVSFRAPCPVGSMVTVGGEVTGRDETARTATLAVWVELPDGARVIDRRRSNAVVSLS